MAVTALAAETRTARGSRACNKLRRSGLVPANVYGHETEPVAVQMHSDAIETMLKEGHKVVDLDLSGSHEQCIIRELQWDTFGKEVLHVDFVRVVKGELMTVELPLTLHGDAIGLNNGGVLEQPLHTLEIECPALQIPDTITVEIGELKIGDSLHVSDIEVPSQVKVLTDGEALVVGIVDPNKLAAAAETEAADAPAEPEVIGETAAEGDDS